MQHAIIVFTKVPAMIASPDQEGGFNLLGYTCATSFSFKDVFYNQYGITALDMLAAKAKQEK